MSNFPESLPQQGPVPPPKQGRTGRPTTRKSSLVEKVTNVSRKRQFTAEPTVPEDQSSPNEPRHIRQKTGKTATDTVAAIHLSSRKRTQQAPESAPQKRPKQTDTQDVAQARAQQIQTRSTDIQNGLKACLAFQISFTTPEEKNDFCFAIASELQDILENPKEHGKNIYYKKETDITIDTAEGSKTVQIKWTFYINVSPDLKHAKIEINIPESQLGSGTYKRASKEVTFQIPLQAHADSLLVEKARLRPNPGGKDEFQKAIISNTQQQVIKDRIATSERPAYMTEPADVRIHQTASGEERFEMIMTLYCGDLEKVQTYSQEKIKQLLDDVFLTLDVFAESGIVHRDIKPANILLDAQHAYVHDFDLTQIENPVAMSADYIYWDRAGQLGLVSHTSDVVGAILTASMVLFRNSFDQKLNRNAEALCDFEHTAFKKGPEHAFQQIALPSLKKEYEEIWLKLPLSETETSEKFLSHLKKMVDNPNIPENRKIKYKKFLEEATYKIELLNIFCDVMSKEDAFSSALVGSCICHFAKKTSREYESSTLDELKEPFETGVINWIKEELGPATLKKISEKNNIKLDTLKDFLDLPFEDFNKTYSYLSADERKVVEHVLDSAGSLSSLLEKAFEKKLIPDTANNEIFAHLMSKNPQLRATGRQRCFAAFPTMGQIRNRISQISQPMGE